MHYQCFVFVQMQSLILFFLNGIFMCKADLMAAPAPIQEKVEGFKNR